jgi:phosphatidylserine decarboxylase
MTKEGAIFPLPFLILAIVFFIVFKMTISIIYLYIAAGLFLLGMLIVLFFRDPDRKVPDGNNLIISPADGKIIKVVDSGEAPGISIFMGIQNVHVNRSPVDGVIKSITFHQGKFLAAFRSEAMKENQRNEIEIETAAGIVKMNQVTGAIARRTICYRRPGDKVKAGGRIGLIRFGSRIDLYLPSGASFDTTLNMKVRAGETILGHLK